jgi:hypothetical protein
MSIWEEDVLEIQKAFERFRGAKRVERWMVERASDYWVKMEELRQREDREFIGVDGSFLMRPLAFSTFYLARAIAIAPSIGSFKSSKSELLETTSDDLARQHAEAVMAYLEVITASRALEGSIRRNKEPVVLFDGSLSSLIVHKAVLHRSPQFPSIADSMCERLTEMAEMGCMVFVAKRSGSRIYSGGDLPDMILFSSMPKGYSKPKSVKIVDLYNLRDEDLEELESLPLSPRLKTVTVSYARLSDGGPLLKIEVPGACSEDEVRNVVARLSSVSPAGYPVPLLVAHNSAKLRALTLRRALSLLGIRFPSGREALREVLS